MTGQERMASSSREGRVRWDVGKFFPVRVLRPWHRLPTLERILKPIPSPAMGFQFPWWTSMSTQPRPTALQVSVGENKPAERSFEEAL